MGDQTKPIMMVAIDDSNHSYYALEWALDYFFPPFAAPNHTFQLVLIHARPNPPSLLGLSGAGQGSAGSAHVINLVELDTKKRAQKVADKATSICAKREVNDMPVHVMQGDPRNVMTEAVERFHPTILVLGSRGYGSVKRAVLGSVSDYSAHHCSCTVMIVKMPKSKH
ncbi:hypothetical protein WN943_028532 [Citrus x changshan-huyou]